MSAGDINKILGAVLVTLLASEVIGHIADSLVPEPEVVATRVATPAAPSAVRTPAPAVVVTPPPAAPAGGGQVAAAGGGDADAGKRLFVRCVACHSIANNGTHTVGPNLFGVVGRKAATVAGYEFKSKLKGSNKTWTDEELEEFLENPKPLVEGTAMQIFAGLPNEGDRNNLIAYLKTLK
jgi:cytochrome c